MGEAMQRYQQSQKWAGWQRAWKEEESNASTCSIACLMQPCAYGGAQSAVHEQARAAIDQ